MIANLAAVAQLLASTHQWRGGDGQVLGLLSGAEVLLCAWQGGPNWQF